MKRFATLLDRLSYTPSRNGKVALIVAYFLSTRDPDRGYALAALTDTLSFSFPLRKILLELVAKHLDPELYKLSREYVGDTAETLSLIWPTAEAEGPAPLLSEVAQCLASAKRTEVPGLLEAWLNRLDVNGKWALLKFVGGGLRTGVSARLTKIALAEAFQKDVDTIEQIWHANKVPYIELFEWLEGRRPLPDVKDIPLFRPLMLSHAIEDEEVSGLDVAAYQIEWKWDGIRVQLCGRNGSDVKLFTRTGDDITAAFPEFSHLRFNATLDGELLVGISPEVRSFNNLQQRLNRKIASKQLLQDYPVFVRLYDALEINGEDLRALPLAQRRLRLENWMWHMSTPHLDLSEVLTFNDTSALYAAWAETRADGIEGFMLKRKDSAYVSGRPKGLWWKWKRAALTIDVVMIYAQRGSGKRSSLFSDFTFAAWDESQTPPQLVPVAKAYSGFTDEELGKLDKFVRTHTLSKFGPVRQLEPQLVIELAFDGVQESRRHKSGVAMRFPRISRIRWDKPPNEAATVEEIRKLIR